MQNGVVFQKPAWQAIASLSIPSLISILVMMLYNMADMYFVSWLGDLSAVGAVSMAGPVFSLLMAVSTMLGNGGCTKIAQALGKQDTEQVRGYTALCVWASIVFGVVFSAACFLGCDPLLRFLGANAEMWDDTKSYVLIMAAGTPIVLLNHTLGSVLRGEGEVKAGLAGSMISTVSNILLDPIFIVVLGLGVGGAAAATVLGNAIAVAYFAVYRARHKERCIIELDPHYARDLWALGGILALGLPNAISSILSGLAGTFSNRLLVAYSTAAVAAMGAAGKATMVVTMIQMGICMGIQPLLAYCYGGKEWARLKEIVQKLLMLTVGLGAAFTVVIFAARGAVIGLFIQDGEAAALGQRLLCYQLLLGPFIGLYYLATNFLQASGKAAWATVASALRQGLLLIPLLYLMNSLLGLDGLALAHTAADGVSIILTGAAAMYCFRRMQKI